MRAIYVDSFSGALGDLPKKRHAAADAVLAVLREHPRFSVWDADATPTLARTMDWLHATGRIAYDPTERYPWCRVTVTPEGGSDHAE